MKLLGFDITRRSSGENPATSLANPEQWLREWVGQSVNSGVTVNEDTALRLSAVFACIRILSESIASLPLIVYERTKDGKAPSLNHPIARLLHDSPNDDMTSFIFRETLQGHVSAWGNGYAFIESNNARRPISLRPLLPDRTWAERKGGKLRYITKVDGQAVAIDPWQVLHIPGLGFDGISGYSPIRLAAENVGVGLAAQEFGARFFGSGATLSGVLEHPGKVGAEAQARLKESWKKAHSGLGNSHNTAVLEEGLKYTRIGIPPEEAQFLETRKFQISEIARIYRIPPHMLADLERATFSNIEQQSLEFVIHTLRPWLVRWEQEINKKLFLESEKGRYFVEFKVDALLRGDTKSRYEAYNIGKQAGFLSTNDIRKLENMNPVKGGDTYLEPMNMAPAGSQANSARALSLAQAAAERIARKEAGSIEKIADDSEKVRSFYEKHADFVADVMKISRESAESYVKESLDQLKNGVNFAEWERSRADALVNLALGDENG